jgi:peptidoglycan/xylan/chitin deacetylase (PgdA/CDA1 family)
MTGQETEDRAARRLGGWVRTRVRGAAVVGMAIAGLALVIALLWTEIAFAGSASVVYRGSTERKQIALTFDDNTVVSRALATLRALQQNEVPATLFLIGSAVGAYPAINYEIGKGMMGGWFEVGDHTWSHPVLTKLSTAALASQIGGGTDAFHEATGARTVPLFRPPYGTTDSRVAAVAGSEGFRYLVLWDVDPRDWAGGSASAIADHVVAHAHNGAIVVMHLSAPNTAAAIPSIVSRLRAQGYEFVTISTMLKGDRLFLDADTSTESGQAIARMVEEGFMSGYDGNYFGPGDAITRAQVAKVATLVGGLHTPEVENAGSPSFPDVPLLHDAGGDPLAYPFDFVEEATTAGLVEGTRGPGETPVFNPNDAITRVQLAQILARMARELKGYGSPSTQTPASAQSEGAAPVFPDVPEYAAADVALVAELGLMKGYSEQEFRPWAGAKRAQVALVMSRYLDLPEVWPAG